MLLLERGETAQFKFVFVSENLPYDPTNQATPIDVYFTIIRGDYGTGPVIDGPYSYLNQDPVPTGEIYIDLTNSYEFVFHYQVPANLLEGVYSVVAQTYDAIGNLSVVLNFQVKSQIATLNPVVVASEKSAVINYKATYEELNQSNTNTLLLIGHADNIELNVPTKIRSVESAVNLLGADYGSPLLRGVLDAYAAGARDIIICASAPMSEYVSNTNDRNTSTTIFDLAAASPSSYTFYEKYYERLAETYSMLIDMDFVDMIVPLETSFINTGNVDFLTQLATYLNDFHNNTGFVQLGIIGTRSNGLSSSDVDEIVSNQIFTDKFTQIDVNGNIISDKGRFVVPIYGEGTYNHAQVKFSYSNSVAASLAGMFVSTPMNVGLIRTRMPGVFSVFGQELSHSDVKRLEEIGVNTIYKGKRSRMSIPNEVYVTNEYTMAYPGSTLSKTSQMRLIANVVSEVRGFAWSAIGNLGSDIIIGKVRSYLEDLVKLRIIREFSFNVEVSALTPGKLIFYIELLASLGLRKVNFAVSAGPGA